LKRQADFTLWHALTLCNTRAAHLVEGNERDTVCQLPAAEQRLRGALSVDDHLVQLPAGYRLQRRGCRGILHPQQLRHDTLDC